MKHLLCQECKRTLPTIPSGKKVVKHSCVNDMIPITLQYKSVTAMTRVHYVPRIGESITTDEGEFLVTKVNTDLRVGLILVSADIQVS